MIKLTIDNQEDKENEYLAKVKEDVVKRIEFLKISLSHLNGGTIDLNQSIASVKVVTRNAIKIIEGKNFNEKGDYNKSKYVNTVKLYLTSTNQLLSVNIKGIIDILNNLIKEDGIQLNELLICPPDELFSLNESILSGMKPVPVKEFEIIKLAFDYNAYGKVSTPIKKFFKDNNFINYCPYCNLENVAIIPIDEEKNATGHQLDHFFSQTDYPLLSYSMFNLVPSGSNCNSAINKGSIPFTNEFHINPYTDGFGDSARFIPIKVEMEVVGIDIKFNCLPGSKKFKQLAGDKNIIDERHNKGNINVFKLKAKYSDEEHVEDAKNILQRVHNAHKGRRSIEKFINMMTNSDLEAIHLKWYKDQIRTPFYSENFGKRKNSKFNRDIHDYYFEDGKLINRFFQYVYTFLKKY